VFKRPYLETKMNRNQDSGTDLLATTLSAHPTDGTGCHFQTRLTAVGKHLNGSLDDLPRTAAEKDQQRISPAVILAATNNAASCFGLRFGGGLGGPSPPTFPTSAVT
jgi:hypothetical protein